MSKEVKTEMGEGLLIKSGSVAIGQRAMALNQKRVDLD